MHDRKLFVWNGTNYQLIKGHMRLNRTADVLGVEIKELQVEKHRNTIMEINITSEIPDCKSLQKNLPHPRYFRREAP